MTRELLIGLVSISDRASSGVYADQGLPALKEWFGRALASPWRMESRLIGDEQALIEATLIELCDQVGCDLGLKQYAMSNRQLGAIRGKTLLLNLPGQPKSIKETLEGVKDAAGKVIVPGIFAAVPYCLDLIGGPYVETHEAVSRAFRPKSAIRS